MYDHYFFIFPSQNVIISNLSSSKKALVECHQMLHLSITFQFLHIQTTLGSILGVGNGTIF